MTKTGHDARKLGATFSGRSREPQKSATFPHIVHCVADTVSEEIPAKSTDPEALRAEALTFEFRARRSKPPLAVVWMGRAEDARRRADVAELFQHLRQE